VVEVAAGNSIVNVADAVFCPPKLNTATDAFVVLLYIKAPAAVKFAGLQVTLANVT
jgi:heptaprenylglyceryl phosphate synthase